MVITPGVAALAAGLLSIATPNSVHISIGSKMIEKCFPKRAFGFIITAKTSLPEFNSPAFLPNDLNYAGLGLNGLGYVTAITWYRLTFGPGFIYAWM